MEGDFWRTNPKVFCLRCHDLHEVVEGTGGWLGGVGALSLVSGEQQRRGNQTVAKHKSRL